MYNDQYTKHGGRLGPKPGVLGRLLLLILCHTPGAQAARVGAVEPGELHDLGRVGEGDLGVVRRVANVGELYRVDAAAKSPGGETCQLYKAELGICSLWSCSVVQKDTYKSIPL